MALFTEQQHQLLLQNGGTAQAGKDHYPVAKIYFSGTKALWLLTELDPDAPDIAFGLCDMGYGYPELMPVCLSELSARSEELGQPLQIDSGFQARHPISVYARAAVLAGHITEDSRLLALAYAEPNIVPASAYKLSL